MLVDLEKVLEELVVPDCVCCGYINVIESTVRLRPPGGLDQVVPSIEVLLVRVHPILEDSVCVGEHWFDVTDDKVEFPPTSFAHSGSNRPDEREDEHFLNECEEVSGVTIFCLLVSAKDNIVELGKVFDAS